MYTYKSDIFTSDPEKLKQKDFEWQIWLNSDQCHQKINFLSLTSFHISLIWLAVFTNNFSTLLVCIEATICNYSDTCLDNK